MIYQQMPHNFIRFDDALINVSQIIEVFDVPDNPGYISICLAGGSFMTVPGTAKQFADICGLDYVDYKPQVKARP